MSWRKRIIGLGLLLALGDLPLAACGFHPMYGKNSVDPAVSEEMASVYITPIRDRSGQLLHNALLTNLNPKGEPTKPVYRLEVSLGVSDSSMATLPDDSASRNLVTYTTNYYLYEMRGSKILMSGTSTKQASYDFLQEHYADISAQEAVNKRAAQEVAIDVRNTLASYFIRAKEVRSGATPAKY